jgi:hypothetical protein
LLLIVQIERDRKKEAEEGVELAKLLDGFVRRKVRETVTMRNYDS